VSVLADPGDATLEPVLGAGGVDRDLDHVVDLDPGGRGQDEPGGADADHADRVTEPAGPDHRGQLGLGLAQLALDRFQLVDVVHGELGARVTSPPECPVAVDVVEQLAHAPRMSKASAKAGEPGSDC